MSRHFRRKALWIILPALALLPLLWPDPAETRNTGVASASAPATQAAPAERGKGVVGNASAAGNHSAAPQAMLVTEDRGSARTFEIALDEVASRDGDGKIAVIRLDPPATPESLPARIRELADRGDVSPVCYEPGMPRTEKYRRIVTSNITLKIPAEQQVPALPRGVTFKDRPAYAPGYAVVSAADPLAAVAALESLRALPAVASADVQLASQKALKALPNDPMLGQQWHLKYQGQTGALSGSDVNIEGAWLYGGAGGVKGSGVTIGIVDDGLEATHPDLAQNIDLLSGKDWNGNDNDPSPGAGDDHGTACAGVASARGNNAIGVTGTAPEATLVGMRLIAAPTTDSQEAEALGYLPDLIGIKSNSWGPFDSGSSIEAPGPLTRASIANAAATGRGGRGSIILWAGGNGRQNSDNSNYDGYANDIHTIAIAASDSRRGQSYYSEPGANIVVAAPSSGSVLGITTTDRTGSAGYNAAGDYTADFGGTSSATPAAAGIVALMLEKNPNLGWRDVQEILIRSAAKISPGDSDWIDNAAGYHFNHKFGAGLIDATAAVALADGWTNLGAATSQSVAMTGGPVSIPDNNATGITREFSFTGLNVRVEHVTVQVNITHTYRGDLEIILTSPSGTASRLAEARLSDSNNNYPGWTFSSVRAWGENSLGTWRLRVIDRQAIDTGSLTAATVTLHGASVPPINPAPSVQITSPATDSVFSPGATVNVTVAASDLNSDGSPGTIASVQLLDGGVPVATDTTEPFEFALEPELGVHSLTAMATDGGGRSSTSGAVSFTVKDQAPVITAATLSPAAQAFADEPVEITGVIASDPEGQSLTFDYAWEKSSDAFEWEATAITSDSLPPDAANAGYLWRCGITAHDGINTSETFVTAPVNLLVRPPATATLDEPFSYASGLVLRSSSSPIDRSALINEFSQGGSGVAEWVELLILREDSFRGWKLADAAGNSLVFADNPAWDDLPVGTLVVIYNGSSKDALLPPDGADPSDGRIVLSSSDPTRFSGVWPEFFNNGDAVVLNDSANDLVAGFSYGASTALAPNLGSIDTGAAAFYAGAGDAGADDGNEWKVTTSQIARRDRRQLRPARGYGDLIISEYVEGSANNKVLEFYNPLATAVNLAAAGYKVEIYYNGSTTGPGVVHLTGTVAAKDVHVVKNINAHSSIAADQTTNLFNFSGDDAILLKKGEELVDSFGQFGVDPGLAWEGGGVSTQNRTLVRKSSVTGGDMIPDDEFDPSREWIQLLQDTFSGLGAHVSDPLPPLAAVEVSPSTILESAGEDAATGTVTVPVAPQSDLSVGLVCSDPDVLTVPAMVVIPAGETTVTFPVGAVDDEESDGTQTAVITASASGHYSGTFLVTVNDDEPSIIGVTPGGGNTVENEQFVADLRAGLFSSPSLFRFGAAGQVPDGLVIDPATGVVSGTPTGPAGASLIVIERYNVLGEVVEQSFTLGVSGGGGYEAWIAGFPGLSDIDAGDDPDGDQMSNLLEYYFGSQPGIPDAAETLPVVEKDGPVFTFTWWHSKLADDVTGTAEWSDTLGSWSTAGVMTEVIGDTPTHEQFRATLSLEPGDSKKFLRLRVE